MVGSRQRVEDFNGTAMVAMGVLALACVLFSFQPAYASVSVVGIPLWLADAMVVATYLGAATQCALAGMDFLKEDDTPVSSHAYLRVAIAGIFVGLATLLAFLTRGIHP